MTITSYFKTSLTFMKRYIKTMLMKHLNIFRFVRAPNIFLYYRAKFQHDKTKIPLSLSKSPLTLDGHSESIDGLLDFGTLKMALIETVLQVDT